MSSEYDEMLEELSGLVEDDPDAALEQFSDWMNEAAEGDASKLQDCAVMLLAFFEADDLDSLHEALEDLPADSPHGLVGNVMAIGARNRAFVDEVVASIGGHPSLSIDELASMMTILNEPNAGDSDEYNRSRSGRASVAECPNATEAMLLELASDPSWEIRYRVALNPSLPRAAQSDVLEASALTDSPERQELVRSALAVNPATDDAVLGQLAESGSPMVRTCLRQRGEIPHDVIVLLDQHDDTDYVMPQTRLIWWSRD